ncbi:FecR family protein [uncultured Sunxiuqinia sp.]|uniref:FecR family protein n=1 Tax=uncultured Sunxiuqinia sp. TaxID=1573825 RepID=UPI0030D6D891|tara:strand:+ start:11062 stop:12159 length:1098 start_codon:yes stop_codon:yes gene_type:complete
MKMNSDIDLLILDYIEGTLSKEQETELCEWVEASEQNTEYFSQSIAYLELTYTASKSEKYNSYKNWGRIESKINKRSKLLRIGREFAKIAAVFVFAFVLGYFYVQFTNSRQQNLLANDFITTEVPYGSRSVVTLPDGSRVWINAGSSIKYPVDFDETQRIVQLDGEAYFDVITNKSRPFYVETWGLKLKATGTQFNVRAYNDEEFIEAILVEGEVAVNRAVMPHKTDLILKPNQKLTVYRDHKTDVGCETKPEDVASEGTGERISTSMKVAKVELTSDVRTDIYTSWKDKEWVIYKEKFGSLAHKLEKRYDVKIKIQDEAVFALAYSGTLKDENLKEVLDVLSITSPIKYVFDDKNVTIWYNPEF